jgi:Ca-activated chloride channel family protein
MVRQMMRVVVIAAVCCAPLVAVQNTQDVFRSESDLVVLHVNVFNGRSDAVPELPQSAFRVFEDEQPQEITFFSGADVPVAVGLILDNSSSMIARQGMLIAGGAAFARSSHENDELFTIHFNEHIQFGLPGGVLFTDRGTLLQAALSRYRPGGRTALYDAVIAGLNRLESASNQKRVLVVLSDGEDNASAQSEDAMLERARASNTMIYTVSNANRYGDLGGGDAGLLRRLARVTGGTAYFPDTDREVVESLDRIAGNIRRGYLIGYVPSNGAHDGTYRHVKVLVRVPGKRDLRVQSRDGYRAHSHADAR